MHNARRIVLKLPQQIIECIGDNYIPCERGRALNRLKVKSRQSVPAASSTRLIEFGLYEIESESVDRNKHDTLLRQLHTLIDVV